MSNGAAERRWINPNTVTWAVSALMATGGSYMMIARDNTDTFRTKDEVHSVQIAVMQNRIELLDRDMERLREEMRRER